MSYDVKDFAAEVVEKSRAVPVVVDFWATWCGPCRVLGPVLERLEKSADGQWVLARVDTDVHQDIAREFGIRGIPNVRLFVDGKSAAEFTGALPEPAVVQWLRKNLPDPLAKEIEKAGGLLQTGESNEAIAILKGVLKRDGENHAAKVLLALALFPDNHAEAAALVHDIEADSEHFALADAIRTVADLESRLTSPGSLTDNAVKKEYLSAIEAMSRNNFEEAINGFIRVIRQEKTYDNEGARRGCVALFRILGDESDITRTKRREFSSALFV